MDKEVRYDEERVKHKLFDLFVDAIVDGSIHNEEFGNTYRLKPMDYAQRAMDSVYKYGLQMKIEQSYRCADLVEANRRSNEDGEYYSDIVLLDIDDLQDELKD